MKEGYIYKMNFIDPSIIGTWYGVYNKNYFGPDMYDFTHLHNTGVTWNLPSFVVYKDDIDKIEEIGLPINHPELLI